MDPIRFPRADEVSHLKKQDLFGTNSFSTLNLRPKKQSLIQQPGKVGSFKNRAYPRVDFSLVTYDIYPVSSLCAWRSSNHARYHSENIQFHRPSYQMDSRQIMTNVRDDISPTSSQMEKNGEAKCNGFAPLQFQNGPTSELILQLILIKTCHFPFRIEVWDSVWDGSFVLCFVAKFIKT